MSPSRTPRTRNKNQSRDSTRRGKFIESAVSFTRLRNGTRTSPTRSSCPFIVAPRVPVKLDCSAVGSSWGSRKWPSLPHSVLWSVRRRQRRCSERAQQFSAVLPRVRPLPSLFAPVTERVFFSAPKARRLRDERDEETSTLDSRHPRRRTLEQSTVTQRGQLPRKMESPPQPPLVRRLSPPSPPRPTRKVQESPSSSCGERWSLFRPP